MKKKMERMGLSQGITSKSHNFVEVDIVRVFAMINKILGKKCGGIYMDERFSKKELLLMMSY